MIDFSQIIHRTFDDSYVITKNGMPYHVYPYSAEFAEEWDEAFAYAEAHPECVTEEKPYVPTLDELKAACPKFIDTRCFRGGQVYNNNARTNAAGGNDYYESAVVNPDLVLRDLVKIFHPELVEEDFVYYKQLK